MFGLDPDNKQRSVAVDRTGAIMTGGSAEKYTLCPAAAHVYNANMLNADASSDWFDAQGMNSMSFSLATSAGITGGVVVFEQTDDITANAVTAMSMLDLIDPLLNRVPLANLTANSIRHFAGPVFCRWIRVRVSNAVVGGTLQVASSLSAAPFGDIGPQRIQGTVADGSTPPLPLLTGGVALTSNPGVGASNRIKQFLCTMLGVQVVRPYSIPEADWSYTGTLNSTTAATAKAASAIARNYVTGLQYQNTNGTATTITVLDGSTVLLTLQAPANMAAPAVVSFHTPLRGTLNTALNVNCGTAGAAVLMNVQGYQAP